MKQKKMAILVSCAYAVMMLNGCSSSGEAEETQEEEIEETVEESVEVTEDTEEITEESEEALEEATEELEETLDEAENEAETVIEESEEETGGSDAEDASDLLLTWKTTQYFTDKEVEEEDIEKIVNAGINTTSGMNEQPWHFSVVTDKEVLEEIADGMSMGAPAGAAPADEEEGEETQEEQEEGQDEETVEETQEEEQTVEETTVRNKAGIADVPLAIIISCAEGSDLDAGLACQSMFIEARLLGYGAKIVSSPTMVLNGDDQDYYRELLGIPEEYSVATVLLVGVEDTSIDETMDGVTGPSERNDSADMVTYVEAQ